MVQALKSLHGAVLGVNTHPVKMLHESVVQGLLSLQTIGAFTQPIAGLQESVVQRLPSSHVGVGPE